MTHKETLMRITRDDTEHGKEYYLASDVDALLEQPEQEPVAVLFEDGSIVKYEDLEFVPEKSGQRVQMLYTTPPQRKLTDEQKSILNFLLGADDFEGVWYGDKHPHKKGAFWWRDELRKAFQPFAKENGPTGQNGAVIPSVKSDVTWKLNELYTTPPQPKEPEQEPVAIYQYKMGDGSWIDQEKHSYDYNKRYAPNATVRVVYTTPPQRKE